VHRCQLVALILVIVTRNVAISSRVDGKSIARATNWTRVDTSSYFLSVSPPPSSSPPPPLAACISRAATDWRQSSTRLQCDCPVCGRVNDVPSFSMCHTAFFGSWCSSTTTSPCTARCFQEPIGRQ